ncbi:MAG TPA: hypothetical protein VJZ31_00085 [Bacilli bacterium]|nr:hypothetical protein [Bacilli bacterium]
MNEAFEKLIKFNYYKNRIFTTIGLIIGLFNPLLGFPIVAITYYFYRKSEIYSPIKPRKEDKVFILVSLILLGVFLVIYFVNIIEALKTVDPTTSGSLLNLIL